MTRQARRWATAGIVLFAALATVSALDRTSEQQPDAAPFVPQMFRSHAARAAAAQALVAGDNAAAKASARQAIEADPLDRRGTAYLAAARALGGGDAEAGRAFRLSNALSRREPVTQSYFYGSAIDQGDYRAAARRVDILLRAHPEFPASQRFLSRLEAVPAGRNALLERVSHDPAWANAYLEGYRADDAVLQARAASLAEEADRIGMGCRHLAPMIRALERRNLRSDARRLKDAQCPGLAGDDALANRGSLIGSARWRRHPAGDVRIGTGSPITLASRASVTRLMLSRDIALEPGDYRAFVRVNGKGADRVAASLDCSKAKRPARGGGVPGGGQLLRAGPCDDLVIGIWLRPGDGTVTLDDLRLERIEPQPQSRP